MSMTHDQIQERIDRSINNHQFTCQSVGYNIYLMETPLTGYTLPIKKWQPGTTASNQSYVIYDKNLLNDTELKSFIDRHKYHLHTLDFVDDLVIIQDM